MRGVPDKLFASLQPTANPGRIRLSIPSAWQVPRRATPPTLGNPTTKDDRPMGLMTQPAAWQFGAGDSSPRPSRFRMPLFKRSGRSRQPSQQPAFFGIPAHIAVSPLGFGADLGLGAGPEGRFWSVKSGNR